MTERSANLQTDREPAYRSAAAWLDQALATFAEAVERMGDAEFLREHAAAHDEPRSPVVDMVAASLEREYWRRWPEGRDE